MGKRGMSWANTLILIIGILALMGGLLAIVAGTYLSAEMFGGKTVLYTAGAIFAGVGVVAILLSIVVYSK